MKDVSVKHIGLTAPPDFGAMVPRDLPPTYTVRWVPRRKAQVVAAVHAGMIGMPEACRRYRLSTEEYLDWERQYRAGVLTRPRARAQKHALH